MDVDTPFIGGIFCFAVIIIGQFFVMNLILAVIIEAFMLNYKLKLQKELLGIESVNESENQLETGEDDLEQIPS